MPHILQLEKHLSDTRKRNVGDIITFLDRPHDIIFITGVDDTHLIYNYTVKIFNRENMMVVQETGTIPMGGIKLG